MSDIETLTAKISKLPVSDKVRFNAKCILYDLPFKYAQVLELRNINESADNSVLFIWFNGHKFFGIEITETNINLETNLFKKDIECFCYTFGKPDTLEKIRDNLKNIL